MSLSSFDRYASDRITLSFSRSGPCPPCPLSRLLLLCFFFLWPASLPQKALEELAVLVEVFDGVAMVGARALHEIVEVARRVMLGLRACMIGRGDRRKVSQLAAILSVLFFPLRGGALVLILALGLTFVAAFVEARWERRLLEWLDKGPWSQAVGAGTPVDAARVLVWPKPCVDRRSTQGGRQVEVR